MRGSDWCVVSGAKHENHKLSIVVNHYPPGWETTEEQRESCVMVIYLVNFVGTNC
jgi:uncharacterized protein YeaC (DUF1315 family)